LLSHAGASIEQMLPEIEKRDIKEDTVIEQNGHNQSINGRDGRDDD